jgi:CheY-like chemotaxis protein
MKSVCIIDDDPIYLMLVNRIISQNKLSDQVTEYANGSDAFESLKRMSQFGQKLPDVILLDLNMPIWDGWDFLDEFVKINLPHYPEVYIVSSTNDTLEKAKGMSYPMVKRFIIKPILVNDLVSILGEGNEIG